MVESAVSFRKIRVVRMPGFEDRGFEIDNLSPGINIIFGPNASGKTTAMLAMHSLLWPREVAPEGAIIEGLLELDGNTLRIQHQAGHTGYEGPQPAFGPALNRDRYSLALHDLLRTEAKDFAKEIMMEARGGIDIRAAGENLGYSGRIARPSLADLDSATREVREAEARGRSLSEEERKLALLLERKSQAEAAEVRKLLLEKAVECKKAAMELCAAEDALSKFPESLERLRGDELQQLREINGEIAASEASLEASRTAINEARARIVHSGLSERPLDPNILLSLQARCEELVILRTTIDKHEDIALTKAGTAAEARRRIGNDVEIDEDVMSGLDLGGIGDIASYAGTIEDLRAKLAARAAMEKWLSPGEQGRNNEYRQTVYTAIDLLLKWLAIPAHEPLARELRLRGLLRTMGGILLGAGLAGSVHSPFIGAALAAAGLLTIFLAQKIHASTDVRGIYRKDFEALGLENPAAWTEDPVKERLKNLIEESAGVALDLERANRLAALKDQFGNLDAEREALEKEGKETLSRLGIVFTRELPEINLYYLVANLQQWQKDISEYRNSAHRLSELKGEYSASLKAVAGQLSTYGYPAAVSHVEAQNQVKELESRNRDFMRAAVDVEKESRNIADIEQALARRLEKRKAVFLSAGLESDDTLTLERLLDQLKAFLAARKDRETREVLLRQKEKALPSNLLQILMQRELEDLVKELHSEKALAESLSELDQEIGKIRGMVARAKEEHNLESALAHRENSLEKLRSDRESRISSLIGWIVTREIEERTFGEDLPPVFLAARSLFASISRGRYRLDLDRRRGSFTVFDITDNRSRNLDQLSSGSRLQLLISVRVAFIQTQEQGLKLPLLLDETLADTDDARARALISAAIELARTGRQIFYCTCKEEERAKWEIVVSEDGNVGFNTARLGKREDGEHIKVDTLILPLIPRAFGMSRVEYREILSVPRFVPSWEGPVNAHLWYFIEDLATLERLLIYGVSTWGALDNLVSSTGKLPIERPAWDRAVLIAKVLHEASALSLIGRGRPLSESILADCPVVSRRFLLEIVERGRTCGWDPRTLIESLESRDGRVKNFRTAELRSWLTEAGHLDERDKLDPAAVALGAIASVRDDIASGRIAEADVRKALEDAGFIEWAA